MKSCCLLVCLVVAASLLAILPSEAASVTPVTGITPYPDGRPAAAYRLDAQDHGPVLRHGDGPWTKQPEVIPFRTKPGTYGPEMICQPPPNP